MPATAPCASIALTFYYVLVTLLLTSTRTSLLIGQLRASLAALGASLPIYSTAFPLSQVVIRLCYFFHNLVLLPEHHTT